MSAQITQYHRWRPPSEDVYMLFQELYPVPSTLRTIKQQTGEIELYIRVERHLSGPLFTL